MTRIRAAVAEDAALILSFVRELAEYEREPDAVKLTEAELVRDGFPAAGGERYFECLIAEEDGEPADSQTPGGQGYGERPRVQAAGMALFFPVYSTWRGRALHLEDLFVRPQFRGRGIGKALLTKVAELAVERECKLLYWHVLDWNEPAIEFYKSLGAAALDDWTRMRLTDEPLRALAAGRV
jgi:GNAT superfamily N-acetyltransferase